MERTYVLSFELSKKLNDIDINIPGALVWEADMPMTQNEAFRYKGCPIPAPTLRELGNYFASNVIDVGAFREKAEQEQDEYRVLQKEKYDRQEYERLKAKFEEQS